MPPPTSPYLAVGSNAQLHNTVAPPPINSVLSCCLQVYSSGKGVDINADCHRAGVHNNLFTNIDTGAAKPHCSLL